MDQTAVLELMRDMIATVGIVRIRATGTSMMPSIWPRDELKIVRTAAPLSEGLIVAYVRDDRIFIHRIVSVSSGGKILVTQGDRLGCPDPPVNASDVLGVVTEVVRNGVVVSLSERRSFAAHFLRAVSSVSDIPMMIMLKLRQ